MTNPTTTPTASEIFQIKVDATVAVRRFLQGWRDSLVAGMRAGHLADSALDELPIDINHAILSPSGFTARGAVSLDQVIVRAECSWLIQDFIATLQGGTWSIREDMRVHK